MKHPVQERPEFRKVKIQALELLQWALEDMSPPGGPKLHLQCGMEREANMVPQYLLPPPKPLVDDDARMAWRVLCSRLMRNMAKKLTDKISDPDLEKIYFDDAGAFLIEGVTHTRPLVDAVKACERISQAMLKEAQTLEVPFDATSFSKKTSIAHAAFGKVPADDMLASLIGMVLQNEGNPEDIEQIIDQPLEQIFKHDGKNMLIGRGQHCNLSLWLGNKNLFISPAPDDMSDMLTTTAAEAVKDLPHMMMLCRNGNYDRIHANVTGALKTFSLGGINSYKSAGDAVRYTINSEKHVQFPDTTRLEFRHGAPEASPYDVALSSALPLVKSCDEEMQSGNMHVDRNDVVIKTPKKPDEDKKEPVPDTHDKAAALFNIKDHPYFTYLNQLAERKVTRAQQRCDKEPGSAAARLALGEAKELLGIGTVMHQEYCRDYGMRSVMAAAAAASPRTR